MYTTVVCQNNNHFLNISKLLPAPSLNLFLVMDNRNHVTHLVSRFGKLYENQVSFEILLSCDKMLTLPHNTYHFTMGCFCCSLKWAWSMQTIR